MGAKVSKINVDDLEDLRNETNFTKEEITDWFREFSKDCPRGKLNKQDFIKIYNSIFPKGDATKFAEHVFRTFDTNKDGKIDFREFICGMSITCRGSIDMRLSWAFSLYDLDGNGYISSNELHEIVSAIRKSLGSSDQSLNEAEVTTQGLFKEIDKDSDGRLSLEEFLEWSKKEPDVMNLLQSSKN